MAKIEDPITAALIAAAVAMFGIIANNRLIIYRKKREEYIQSAKELVKPFETILDFPITNPAPNGHILHSILIHNYDRQRKAVEELKRHVGFFARIGLNRAWRAYYGGDENNPDFLPYYLGEHRHVILNKRVGAILKFAYRPNSFWV